MITKHFNINIFGIIQYTIHYSKVFSKNSASKTTVLKTVTMFNAGLFQLTKTTTTIKQEE